MELRKNPKIDLQNKRGLFFNIGLALSLAIVLSAFEWRSYVGGPLVVWDEVEQKFDEILDVPLTDIPPPPPPKIEMPVIVDTPDTEELDDEPDFKMDVEFEEEIFEVPDIPEPPVEHVDVIVDFAETMPEPIGGIQAYMTYLARHIHYPNKARRMGIEGRVFVQFVIDKDGSLTDMKVVKGIGGGCDEEAIRVLSEAPQWKPGKQRGKPVKVRMTLPVIYKLN